MRERSPKITKERLAQTSNEIRALRRLCYQCAAGAAAVGLIFALLIPRDSFFRPLRWSGFLFLVPIFRAFNQLRCPYCRKRPFFPSSRSSLQRWRMSQEMASSHCLHCGQELVSRTEAAPDGGSAGEVEHRMREKPK